MANGRVDESSSQSAHECPENCLKVVSDGSKPKLKWFGDFKALQSFIELSLKLSCDWNFVHNNGGYHLFKSSSSSINFYPGTKTLHIQGPKQDEVKHLLMVLAKKQDSGEEQERNYVNDSFTESDSEEEVESIY